MKIAHVALWTERLEELRDFYIRYFGGCSNSKYANPSKGFESYFIAFGDGCRLELMHQTDIRSRSNEEQLGYCHLAFECASQEEVRILTERLRNNGYRILGEPRITGDGYFESIVSDPDGNSVEIVSE